MASPIIIPAIGSQLIFGAYAKFSRKPFMPLIHEGYTPSLSVVIPAKNEGKRIQYALASLDMQTYPIEKVYVIDDGSTDNTYEIITKMQFLIKNLDIEVFHNDISIGKTPAVKFAARKATTEKIMVLDADTILSDPDYIKKITPPHYDPKTASTYGTVRPFSRKDQLMTLMRMLVINHEDYGTKIIKENIKSLKKAKKQDIGYYLLQWPVERYREALYLTDQYFSKDTSLRVYGTTLFPIGCGVMYDRKILTDIFDYYEPTLGDNLTTSEDIFIGFSIVNRGYRNIQIPEAHMISAEPRVNRLPRQLFLWSSSFLQSAYYFSKMTFTFKEKRPEKEKDDEKVTENKDNILDNMNDNINNNKDNEHNNDTKEKIEPMKPKTEKRDTTSTMPLGWIIFFPIFEKVTYPVMLFALLLIDYRYALFTVALEYLAYITIMRFSAPRMSKMHFLKISLVSLPLRFINLFLDIKITAHFIKDMLIGRRDWRK